jgi:hypothetical protein
MGGKNEHTKARVGERVFNPCVAHTPSDIRSVLPLIDILNILRPLPFLLWAGDVDF